MAILKGTVGKNRLDGVDGVKDVFRGFSGSDRLNGNGAADHDVADYSQDLAFALSRGLHVHGIKANLSSGNVHQGIPLDTIIDSFGFRDKVKGVADVVGTVFADIIHGGGGDNVLKGGAGKDLLNGHGGNDTVVGGLGADKLFGGDAADVFSFGKIAESTVAKAGRDAILDFSQADGDRIALSGIDANSKIKGNQDFTFIADQSFHKQAGELRYAQSAGNTFVFGDVNGDGKADFSILIKGTFTLTDIDFNL
jgi:Ca2+-binding RTX toxin-like protein